MSNITSIALEGGRERVVLNICLYGEVPPRGPTPYPLYTIFHEKGTPFVISVPLIFNSLLQKLVNLIVFSYELLPAFYIVTFFVYLWISEQYWSLYCLGYALNYGCQFSVSKFEPRAHYQGKIKKCDKPDRWGHGCSDDTYHHYHDDAIHICCFYASTNR